MRQVQLAKQEMLISLRHVVSPMVSRGPQVFILVHCCHCNINSASVLL